MPKQLLHTRKGRSGTHACSSYTAQRVKSAQGHVMRKIWREMIMREDGCVNRWCAIGCRHKITREGDLGKMLAPSCTCHRFEPGIAHMKGGDGRRAACTGGQTHVTRHTSHVTPHTSHLTPHTSHLTPHTSHLTPHTSHLTRHTSHLTPHTSHLTRHTSHLTPHTSHVTRHTSHVTRHTSHVTRHTSHETKPRPKNGCIINTAVRQLTWGSCSYRT
jgi:hypothetical protein